MNTFARAIASVATLFMVSTPAFADTTSIPEPETLSLLAVGVVALLLARRRK